MVQCCNSTAWAGLDRYCNVPASWSGNGKRWNLLWENAENLGRLKNRKKRLSSENGQRLEFEELLSQLSCWPTYHILEWLLPQPTFIAVMPHKKFICIINRHFDYEKHLELSNTKGCNHKTRIITYCVIFKRW